jgi:fimbrial chaperone protein
MVSTMKGRPSMLALQALPSFTKACLLASALLTGSAPALAGLFSVTPVRIYMAPRDRAVAVTINNEGDEELVMQADIYLWKQKPDGEDDLTLTEDLILSPPILKLAARSRQVVRLAMLKPQPSGDQQTYRLIVREVPEAKPADKNVQLQIALAFSMPVFITPPGAKRQLVCTAQRSAPDTARVTCENSGNAYAQARDFVLTSATGTRLAARDSGGYILPSIKRSFDLKRTEGPLPAGDAKLAVMLDDGTTQTFDVKIAE